MSKIEMLSLVSILKGIKSRRLTCVQVVEAFVCNIEAHSNLNAIIYFNKRQALEEALKLDREMNAGQTRGRLHGAPLMAKDNIHVKSIPNTAGCPALRDFVPKEDADVVRTLRNEGALFLAKTNLHELCFGCTSNNAYYGPVRNAHNPEYTAGGSSGGSGAAIATRQAAAALGTDTGGSVRIPSSANGIFGFRPTHNLYSRVGFMPLSSSRDTIGIMANHIEDIILLDQVITSNEPVTLETNPIKIGVPKGMLTINLDGEISAKFAQTLTLLAKNGHRLIELDMFHIKSLLDSLKNSIVSYEAKFEIEKYLTEYELGINFKQLGEKIASADVKQSHSELSNESLATTRAAYEEAKYTLKPMLISAYKKLFDEHGIDCFLYPTMICLPPRIDEIAEPQTFWSMIQNTNPSSEAGLPCISIPIGKSANNLPIGFELTGAWRQDQRLLSITSQVYNLIKQHLY